MVEADNGFITSNGLGWNLEKTKFYFVDSIKRVIYQYAYNHVKSEIYSREIFTHFTEEQGYPDGIWIDGSDHIWITDWGGYHVYKYAQNELLIDKLKLPAKNITSCCFGGQRNEQLFIASANYDLVDLNDVGEYAGALFIYKK